MLTLFAILGAILVVYWSARVIATAGDFYREWRSGWARLNSDKHTKIVSELLLWPELKQVVKHCQECGEYPFEQGIKIDLEKAPVGDLRILAGFKSPVDVLERQLELLFVRSNVADKMEIRRNGKLLYICSTEAA